MKLLPGERIVVRSPFTNELIGAVVLYTFALSNTDAHFYRNRCDEWQDVRAGDRAFTYRPVDGQQHEELCVGIVGYTDMYIYTR